ncbi:MAG: hypothetical protein IJP01_00930 [Oscillospiraceae bacterium]|nr:hypothetical protein [Oscillospiraceae bacterium]
MAQVKKTGRSQLLWMAVFAVGFAVLYLLGSKQCAAINYHRPFFQNGLHYTLFCTWPFHISKVLGAPLKTVAGNLHAIACATFFLVCGLGLYMPASGRKYDGDDRTMHFFGNILLCSYLCNAMTGSSLYNGGFFHVLFSWCALALAVYAFLRQMAGSLNKQWTLGIYVAGFCFTLAVAGYTRALWVLGLSDKSMLPLYAAKLTKLIADLGRGGIGMMLLSILLQTALALLLAAMWLICRQQQKYSRNIGKPQFWTQFVLFAAMYLIHMKFVAATSTPLALKYWVAVLVSALVLGLMAPKGSKRLLRSLSVIGLPVVLFMLCSSFTQFYGAFYAAFEGPLARIAKRRAALFALIDPELPQKVEQGSGIGVQFLIGIGVALVAALILFAANRMFNAINAKGDRPIPNRREFFLHMLWCAAVVLGVAVRCLNLPYRFVNIIAYVLFSIGAIGQLVLAFACLRLKDRLAVRLLLADAVLLALLITIAAHFAMEVGVVVLVLLAAATMLSFTEFSGGTNEDDEPGELSAVEQFSMAIAMDSALSAIDAGVASGAISSTAGASAAQDIIGAAASRGFFGSGK